MSVSECLVDSQLVVQVLAALAFGIHVVSAENSLNTGLGTPSFEV